MLPIPAVYERSPASLLNISKGTGVLSGCHGRHEEARIRDLRNHNLTEMYLGTVGRDSQKGGEVSARTDRS